MSYPKIKLFSWRILEFIKFFFQAKSKWKIHSPFVYQLVTVVFPHQPTSFGNKVESIRKNYLRSTEEIQIEDFGAGFDNQKKRVICKKLGEITKSSARKRKEGEFLYRIIKHHQPKFFLELGTNLGFSTSYIAKALQEIYHDDYQLVSIEGSQNLHLKAKDLINNLQLKAELIQDTFDNYLEKNFDIQWDGVFIDGNHNYEATLRYFNFLKHHLKNGGFIIFDDIYWSPEMQSAWKQIIQDELITLSIDTFRWGLVYLNKNQAKEHFKIWV